MSSSDLQGAVLAVAGIAAAEVESRDHRGPAVRVWLDGSRPAHDVSADLERVLHSAGYHTPHETIDEVRAVSEAAPALAGGNGTARRAGLGRGLEALIPVPEPEVGPAANRLEMIAIEESADGTVVRAVDATGRSAVAPVANERSLNNAVAATVAGLLGFGEAPSILAVEVRQMGGAPVLVTVIELDGRRASGSSVIESGMPFALGTALWFALRSLA